MDFGHLRDYFTAIGFKRLTAVECDPEASNQHEFQGIGNLRGIFGEQKVTFPTTAVRLLDDESEEVQGVAGTLTWYDARAKANEERNKRGEKLRAKEFHLYYSTELEPVVQEQSQPGDLLIVARRPDDSTVVIIAQSGSTVEGQLVWLFGISLAADDQPFHVKDIAGDASRTVDSTATAVLEALGIAVEVKTNEYLGMLLAKFGTVFPSTSTFSAYARGFIEENLFITDPDAGLMAAYSKEEVLFRTLERHIVQARIDKGFHNVDDFVEFSLSVQNRRKSRAGYALENHLKRIFDVNKISYSWNQPTERKSRPDFLFPDVRTYHAAQPFDPALRMLAVKSSCKDRWRQALEEADKIKYKHLLTLEPSISSPQTDDMAVRNLRLVVPLDIHPTYQPTQREWLLSLRQFIDTVRSGHATASD